MADALEIACEICQKTFTQKSSLKRHYKQKHPGIELPDNIQNMKDPIMTCSTCSKECSKANFQRHLQSCEPKVEQQLPLSSAEERKNKSVKINDTYKKDLSLFHENLPIGPMLHEYYSEKWVNRNFDRRNIDRYISALKQFERYYTSQVELTPKSLFGEGWLDFQSRFDPYFDSLQNISERDAILYGLQRTFEMLHDMKIIGSVQEMWQLVNTKGIIERYLNSSLRSEYFKKCIAMQCNAVGPMLIRNFLLTETILATKSSEFVHQLTREMFLKGTRILDNNQQTKWVFEIGQDKSFEIPDFLKAKLQIYFLNVREHVLPKKDIKQNGKDDIWDPHSDNEIKFFAVSEKGNPFVVEITQSVYEVFYMGGQSHKKFYLKDFTGTEVQYKMPRIIS